MRTAREHVNLGLEFWIAGRYLGARQKEGFISVIAAFSLLGITLGVATLIIVMSVMNGFHTQLVDRIVGVNGHVLVQPHENAAVSVDELVEDPRIVNGFRELESQAMATSGSRARGAVVRGVPPDELRRRVLVADNILSGSLEEFEARGGLVIGQRLARSLGVGKGGTVTLLHPEGAETAFGTMPRVRTWPVAAIFEIGMYEYDSGLMFLPLADAAAFFGEDAERAKVGLLLDDADAAEEVGKDLRQRLGSRARVTTWPRINRQFFNALKVERNVMFLILTLIILVAAFNVVSSMIMLVRDKQKGIAILRTMGASRSSVMRIFVMTGAAVGTAGTVSGFTLGLVFALHIESIRTVLEGLLGTDLFAAEIYFLTRLPSEVDPFQVALVVAMGFGLSLLATLYPSWRAARIDPAVVLRDA